MGWYAEFNFLRVMGAAKGALEAIAAATAALELLDELGVDFIRA